MSDHEEGPFYGVDIISRNEESKVRDILAKFKNEPVTDELKKRIWDELQAAKYAGEITIPFKVVTRRDSTHKFPEYIEVILDTKV
jgi:hypothetical protein